MYSYYHIRNILHTRIYLLRISDPESDVIETEEFSSDGLKNADIASHV